MLRPENRSDSRPEFTLLEPSQRAGSTHFGYANVGTFGLAHSLLAWARCRLWCDTYGVPMLAPSWLHIQHRIGPILRGERDNRQYHRLFHFPGYVSGIRRLQILATARRLHAEEVDLAQVLQLQNRRLVIFTNRLTLNEETHFREIIGQGDLIRQALVAMTRPAYLPVLPNSPHVALHLRMGDFEAPDSIDILRQGSKNKRIPVEWYRDVLERVRFEVGDVSALVYSDGTDHELASLLGMPNVARSPKQPSVTDLLAMSHARLVISSGSGFSMWGAYLGNSPRVCFRGQRFVRVLGPLGNLDLEPECESASELEPAFFHHLRSLVPTK